MHPVSRAHPGRAAALHLDIEALGRREALVLDGVLGAPPCAALWGWAANAFAEGHLAPAGVGRAKAQAPSVRTDVIRWVDPDETEPALDPLLDVFAALGVAVSQQAYLGLRFFEVQLAAYASGAPGYARHVDAFKGAPSRRLTAVYYPNVAWTPGDGGEFLVWSGSTCRRIEPLADRLVVFLSDGVEHAVAPTHRGPRLAITAWYRA